MNDDNGIFIFVILFIVVCYRKGLHMIAKRIRCFLVVGWGKGWTECFVDLITSNSRVLNELVWNQSPESLTRRKRRWRRNCHKPWSCLCYQVIILGCFWKSARSCDSSIQKLENNTGFFMTPRQCDMYKYYLLREREYGYIYAVVANMFLVRNVCSQLV